MARFLTRLVLGGGQIAKALGFALPAPTFTVAPSIGPTSGIAGTTFTATDGTVTGGTVTGRRWLLSGTSIGTGTTVVPVIAGSLVLENTAVGIGGTTVSTSAPVSVTASSGGATASSFAAFPSYGANMSNLLDKYYSEAVCFLNHFKAASPWQNNDGSYPAIDVNGYPTTSNSNAVWCYAPMDSSVRQTGVSRDYVFVSSKKELSLAMDGMTNVVRSTDPTTGGDRVTFTLSDSVFSTDPAHGDVIRASISGLSAATGDWSTFYLVRADQEERLQAGNYFNLDTCKTVGTTCGWLRFMDVCMVNNSGSGEVDLSCWTPLGSFTWSSGKTLDNSNNPVVDQGGATRPTTRWPIEAMCSLVKETLALYPSAPIVPWFCLPGAFTTAGARAFVTKIDGLLPATTRRMVEDSNEVWNFSFLQAGYYRSLYNPAVVSSAQSPEPAWGNYGFRAAELAAAMLDADGHSGKLITVLASQNTVSNVTQGMWAGVRAYMTAVATVGGPYYNADFAARYPAVGLGSTLMHTAAVATYLVD